jgi:hypothetical protein
MQMTRVIVATVALPAFAGLAPAVYPQTHRLYVTRTTHPMVIDTESGKVIAHIPGQKIAHGVAIVPEAGRGFISDGGNAIRIDLCENISGKSCCDWPICNTSDYLIPSTSIKLLPA